jgi:hypothetical protein
VKYRHAKISVVVERKPVAVGAAHRKQAAHFKSALDGR